MQLGWSFTGLHSLDEVTHENGTVTIPAVPDRMRILRVTPSDHTYEASVRVTVEGQAEAGLIVYYNLAAFARNAGRQGFRATPGRQTNRTEPARSELRGVRISEDPLYRPRSGPFVQHGWLKWRQYPVGIEMSGYHHNIFGGFGALSIGVYTKGTGRLRIDNFIYRALD